jgi:CDGSH-type Zn-finger protein
MTDDAVLTVRELGSTLCRCGRLKRKGRTFCDGCVERLTPELRRDLEKQLAEGYLDAYRAAVEFLKRKP